MTKRQIVFEIRKVEGHKIFVARSDDLRGVFAQGETVAQVRQRIPRVIRAFFQAQGITVEAVRTQLVEPSKKSNGGARLLKAEAHLEAA